MSARAEQKERSHESILESAARLVREKGISGAGVAEVMKGAALTVGGFYAHFASKDALVDETLRRTGAGLRERLFARIEEKPEADRAEVLLKRYLSADHRDAGALGYHPTWTGVGISWNFNVVAAASGGGADGIRTLATATTLETPAGRHFAEVMRKAAPNSGADTDDIMLIFYSLIQSTLEGLRRTGPNPTREGFVQTMETKMSGYDSGYLPPPTFGPGNRSGPVVVGVSECCNNGRWFTPQAGWRAGREAVRTRPGS